MEYYIKFLLQCLQCISDKASKDGSDQKMVCLDKVFSKKFLAVGNLIPSGLYNYFVFCHIGLVGY